MVASASIPLKFKNANNQKEGSYFDYPIVEGTNETTYGEPLFNEDGSIDLTSTPAAEMAFGGAHGHLQKLVVPNTMCSLSNTSRTAWLQTS